LKEINKQRRTDLFQGGERRCRNQNRQRKCIFFLFLFCSAEGLYKYIVKQRDRESEYSNRNQI